MKVCFGFCVSHGRRVLSLMCTDRHAHITHAHINSQITFVFTLCLKTKYEKSAYVFLLYKLTLLELQRLSALWTILLTAYRYLFKSLKKVY